MRNFILVFALLLISVFSYGQFADLCGGVVIDNHITLNNPGDFVTVTGSIPAAFGEEGNYDPDPAFPNTAGTFKSGFYAFTVNTSGYYTIHFQAGTGAGAASGILSVGFGDVACPPGNTDSGDIGAGFEIKSNCLNLNIGTTYYISMALLNAGAGDFTITITKGGLDICEGAHVVYEGDNDMSNECSQAPPSSTAGTVWSTYTVGPEPLDDQIEVELSVTPDGASPIASVSVISVWLNGCPASGTGTDITGDLTCLSEGDVLYIETGNTTPAFGTYNLNITQADNGIQNDACENAEDLNILTCSNAITGDGDPESCPDPENANGCAPAETGGVWYTFTVHSTVPEFSFTGNDFQVFTGPDCASLVHLGCDGDAVLQNIEDNPVTTYWVLVFENGTFAAESDVDVPSNDLCADAAPLANGTEGYTTCATGNWNYCGLVATSHTVHYIYTNSTATYIDLDITISGSTAVVSDAAAQVSVAVVEDCGGTAFQGFAPLCNTLGTQFTVGCIPPGESFVLIVGSPAGQEGGFVINITETPNPVVNDICDGAIDFGIIASDCEEVVNTGSNVGACPDDFNNGGCNFNQNNFHGVWYQFTTDANAQLADITTNLAGAIFALYTGNCAAPVFVAGSCNTTGNLIDQAVNPNTTYYLLVSSATENGNFNIGITIKNIPDNDLCVNADDLVNGIEGTNACATGTLGFCGLNTATSHDVYYTYTNNTGATIDLEVTVSASTATTGTAATDVSVAILSACPNTQFFGADPECNTLGSQFTVECIRAGETVILVIGSADGSQGDFSISYTELGGKPLNNECTSPEPIIYTACVWETVFGDNTDACPERFSAGACDFDEEAVVWFSFDATADATSVEFQNLTGAGAFMGLFNNTGNCDAPTAAAPGSACIQGNAGPFNITGGQTYLIAYATTNPGAFNFEIKINEQPAHDDPCAPGYASYNLGSGATSYSDDNTCATGDFSLCGAIDQNNGKTLVYRYTMSQDGDLEIDVNGSGANAAGGPFYIGVYEDQVSCAGPNILLIEGCDGNVLLTCLEQGQVVSIVVGTSDAPGAFGEFTITIQELTPPRPVNDDCDDATDIVYTDADLCQWVGVPGNNENACYEDFSVGNCAFDQEETVWFSVTAPPGTNSGDVMNIRFQNYSGAGSLFAVVFDGNCTNLGTNGPCLEGNGPHAAFNVDPNQTYLIAVGSSGDDGGSFDIEVNITSGPPNDDACADMSSYNLTGGATLTDQTNACSSAGVTFPECGAGDQTNSVFYEFTISPPNYGMSISITGTGAEPIQGTVVAGVSATDTDFCGGNQYTPPAYCESGPYEYEFICLEPGTYQLQISSSDANAGTFTITASPISKPNTGCNDNDVCQDATPLTYSDYCEWVDYGGCNNGACPDPYVLGACDLSSGPTVWYSVDIPADAGSLEAELVGAEFNPAILTVWDGCPVNAGWCAANGQLDPIDISVYQGQTLYIAVTDGSGGEGGKFSLRLKIDVPPENDDPCPTNTFGAYDLGAQSGSHSGTTCCASEDFPNAECSAATETNTVWYIFDPRTDSEGVEINVTGGTISGPVTVEVFAGDPNMGCTGTLTGFQAASCTALPATLNLGPCWEDGDILYIKVASTEDNCGTFSISVSDSGPSCDNGGRTCEDAPFVFSLVTDPNYANIYPQCVNLCLEMACPDPTAPPGCDFSQSPTVWIMLETDEIPSQLITSVEPAGSWDPLWTVYFGDCDNLTPIANNLGTDCNFDVATTPIQSDANGTITTYYVAITADPNGPPIDDPNFEFCAYTRIEVLTCIGPDYGCQENDPDTEIEVLWREFDGPLEGPFCPGEEVRIKIHFFYDAAESQVDWFHGFIPNFGPGWDILNFDWEAELPIATGPSGGPGSFHEEGTECESELHRSFPHLCTYRDELGILRLVHTECDEDITKCEEFGMEDGDVLPNGFFWLSDGSNASCVSGSCRPRQRWGVGSKTSTVDWEFNIKVREFENEAECLQNRDLQIGFLAFSDDGAGCWDDATPCRLDKKQYGPEWQIECTVPPNVIAQPKEICTGSALGLNVSTEDGSANLIEITFEDNPNVTGMNNHTFPGGFGVINDVLTIVDPDACEPEIVIYYGQVLIPGLICQGKIDTFEVTVYPLPRILEQDPLGACLADLTVQVPFEAECGKPDYTYAWRNTTNNRSGTGNQYDVQKQDGVGTHIYSVTVTDALGCLNTGQLQFNVHPDVKFRLQGDTLCWEEEKTFDVEIISGGDPGDLNYDWYWQSGIGFGGTEPTYPITSDQYGWDYFPGEEWLCLIITAEYDDGTYCESDTCVRVLFRKPFKTMLEPDPAYICAGQSSVTVEIIFDEENGLSYNDVQNICWNGQNGTNCSPFLVSQDFTLSWYNEEVTITDIYGCDTTMFFDVLEHDISDLEIDGDTDICEGESTTLTVIGDFVSWEWDTNPPSTDEFITVSPMVTTTYKVSALNASGCVSTGEVTVQVFGAEVPSIPDSVSFCTGYSVTYTAPGGYETYTWYLNDTGSAPVSNTPLVVMSQAGNYILVVTTDHGCEAQNTIVATEDDELTPSVFGEFLICYEQPTAEVWAAGGDFVLLEWRYNDENGDLVPNTLNQDTVNLSDGTYYLWVSDGNCEGSTTFTINRKDEIIFRIIPEVDTVFLCFGNTTSLSAPAGFTAYAWSSGQFTRTINNVGQGNYCVTVTDSDGCKGSACITVVVLPRLLPRLDNIEICFGESTWLSPGEFNDYLWYKDGVYLPEHDGKDSLLVTESGIYRVVVSNWLGCTAEDDATVIVQEEVVPEILGIVDLCDNDMIVLSSSQDYFRYRWTNSDGTLLGTGKTLNFTMTFGRDFEQVTLSVETQLGCTGSVTMPVLRYNSPVLRLTDDVIPVCGINSTGGNTVLDFSGYFTEGNNSQGTWADFDGSGVVANADWTQVDFSNVNYDQTYRFVFITNIAEAPCADVSDTLYVNVIPCICDQWYIADIPDVCNNTGGSPLNLNLYIVDINGNRITPPPPGNWTVTTGPSTSPLSGSSFNPVNAPAGIYTLRYRLNNIGNYCEDVAFVTIEIKNAVSAGLPLPYSQCAGIDATIVLMSLLEGATPGGTWTETSSVPSTGGAFNATAGTFSTLTQPEGTYTFTYLVEAEAPCPDDQTSVTIILLPVPIADAGPDQEICFEDKPVTLVANPAGPSYKYAWRLKGTTDILSQTRELQVNQSGTYVVKVELGDGCFTEDEVVVTIRPQIVVQISGPSVLVDGQTDTLFASFTGRQLSDNVSYYWSLNGEMLEYDAPFIVISEAGLYCVDVEDDLECLGGACYNVGVELTREIEVPNIFTPDGDNINDIFFVKDGKNVKHIRTIQVFDRWGELVWRSEDFSFDERRNHYWDGTFRGKKAVSGVYVYLVEFIWSDDEEDFVVGDVTLVR